MVKFNPKIANKFANRTSARIAAAQATPKPQPLSVMELLRLQFMRDVTKELFGADHLLPLDNKDLTKAELYVHISVPDFHPTGTLHLDNQNAGHLIEAKAKFVKEFKEYYTLFVDDERIPDKDDVSGTGTCIVARTNHDAKKVVELFGAPEYMYLDYYLRYGENTEKFTDWFIERYTNDATLAISEHFHARCHSGSDDGQRIIHKKLRPFVNMVWERTQPERVKAREERDARVGLNPTIVPPPVIGAY